MAGEGLSPGYGVLRQNLKSIPGHEVKDRARGEYLTVFSRKQHVQELGMVLSEFQTSLNRAVWDKTREGYEVVNLALLAKGNPRALHEARKQKGVELEDDLAPSKELDQEGGITKQERQRRKRVNEERAPAQPIQEEAKRKVFEWFRHRYPGAISLVASYINPDQKHIDPQKRQEMESFIADGICRWILVRNTLGVGKKILVQTGPDEYKGRNETEEKVIEGLGEYLIANAQRFQDLKGQVGFKDHYFWEDAIDQVHADASLEEATLLLDDQTEAFVMREWIKQTGTEARDELIGRKIFETPYYRRIIQKLHFESRKKNGVGGVILDGPPGVGKTELIQEKNRQQGFKTRVIGIHYYTNVAELLGEKKMQIRTAQGVVSPESLATIVQTFKSESGDRFKDFVTETFKMLQTEGKVPEGQTLSDFLLSFTATDTANLVSKPELTTQDWEAIRDSFIRRQEARMFRAGLEPKYQETVTDIVAGEVALAIQNGEKGMLDEVEKAGPNAMGGMLTFIAKSPGRDVLRIGETDIEIPPWFTLDATSNSAAKLDPFLKDRFAHMSIDTPPVKDQLMIAGVRISDAQGNVLLTGHEQRRLVGFFTYVVPEINNFLIAQKMEPISIRSIKDLSSYLVDFESMQRKTEVSFGEALRRLLLMNRAWEKNPELSAKFEELSNRYNHIFNDPDQNLSQETPFVARALSPLEMVRASIGRTLDSPLIAAVNGLPEEPDSITSAKVKVVQLDESQQGRVLEFSKAQERKRSRVPGVKKLPTGLRMELKGESSGNVILKGVGNDDSAEQLLLVDLIDQVGNFEAVSADGKVMMVATYDSGGETKDVFVYKVFGALSSLKNGLSLVDGRSVSAESIVSLDPRGQVAGILKKGKFEKNNLDIKNTQDGNTIFTEPSVEGFEFSSNGKYVLISKIDGSNILYSLTAKQRIILPVTQSTNANWRFTKDNLIVQQDDSGVVNKTAYLLAA